MNAEVWRKCVSCPVKEKQKLTGPGIPRRSPIQVLTRPRPCLNIRDRNEIGRAQGWYGRKRIHASRAGYLKKTHRGCISERFKNKSAMPVFNRNQIKSKK